MAHRCGSMLPLCAQQDCIRHDSIGNRASVGSLPAELPTLLVEGRGISSVGVAGVCVAFGTVGALRRGRRSSAGQMSARKNTRGSNAVTTSVRVSGHAPIDCRMPSQKQLEFAESLARAARMELPNEVQQNKDCCSRFIQERLRQRSSVASRMSSHSDAKIDGGDDGGLIGEGLQLRSGAASHRAEKRFDSADGGDGAATVTLTIPKALYDTIPMAVRSQGADACDRYVQVALDIGLKSLSYAGVSLDTSAVHTAFNEFSSEIRRYQSDFQKSLEQLLSSQLTGEDSRLASTLVAKLGEKGTLATLLDDAHRRLADPQVKTSLPHVVTDLVRETLQDERALVRRLVDAADPQSPLGLFLAQQRQSVQAVQDDYAHRIVALEGRIVKQMDDIRVALNVDKILESQQDVIAEQLDKSASKGKSFEEDAYDALVKMASVFGDRVVSCGDMRVEGTPRKIGDQLIYVHQSGLPELTIVVEQKAGKVNRKALLQQMSSAMDHRGASAAIGLAQRKHIPASQSAYEQHGPCQVVVGVEWTESTDWFALEVAYRTLRSHLIASAFTASSIEFDANALQSRVERIKQALGDIQKVKVNATASRNSLNAITSVVADMEERIRAELAAIECSLRPLPH